jgi:hypothetical protein
METKLRVERPPQTIKNYTTPLDNGLKLKTAAAFQEVVNQIKRVHL